MAEGLTASESARLTELSEEYPLAYAAIVVQLWHLEPVEILEAMKEVHSMHWAAEHLPKWLDGKVVAVDYLEEDGFIFETVDTAIAQRAESEAPREQ